jgi:hypothetical protein
MIATAEAFVHAEKLGHCPTVSSNVRVALAWMELSELKGDVLHSPGFPVPR